MRAITFFPHYDDYARWALNDLFPDPDVPGDPYNRLLVGWVIQNKSPLFYSNTHDAETGNYSNFYNWVGLRDDDRYDNPTVRSLYLLHELAHIVVEAPHDLSAVTANEYAEATVASEYVASNETELLVHWRNPSLRRRILPGTEILWDVLSGDLGWDKPDAASLYGFRAALIETDTLDPLVFAGRPGLRSFFKRFAGNRPWAAAHHTLASRYLNRPSGRRFPGLHPLVYERQIEAWQPDPDPARRQARYEANVLANARIGVMAAGGAQLPRSFHDVPGALADLEGTVFFDGHTTATSLDEAA